MNVSRIADLHWCSTCRRWVFNIWAHEACGLVSRDTRVRKLSEIRRHATPRKKRKRGAK